MSLLKLIYTIKYRDQRKLLQYHRLQTFILDLDYILIQILQYKMMSRGLSVRFFVLSITSFDTHRLKSIYLLLHNAI